MDSSATGIVDFWLADSIAGPEQAERRRAVWYHGGKALDDAIAGRFGSQVEAALAGELDHWQDSPESALGPGHRARPVHTQQLPQHPARLRR